MRGDVPFVVLKFYKKAVRLNFKILSSTGKTALARNFRSEFEQNFENLF